MPLHDQPLEVSWIASDGRTDSLAAAGVKVEVPAGLLLELALEIQANARIYLRLKLSGRRPVSGSAVKDNARFVIIPLGDSSLLLGVAEPSDEPEALTPVLSTPVVVASGHRRIATQGGTVKVRGPDSTGLDIDFVPGVGGRSACVLRIAAASGDQRSPESRHGSARLAVVRLSEDAVTIVAAPIHQGEDAI